MASKGSRTLTLKIERISNTKEDETLLIVPFWKINIRKLIKAAKLEENSFSEGALCINQTLWLDRLEIRGIIKFCLLHNFFIESGTKNCSPTFYGEISVVNTH